jgi:hypothetical protein
MTSELLTLAGQADQRAQDQDQIAIDFDAADMGRAAQLSRLRAASFADAAARLREIAFELRRR